jgi:glucokinase
MTTASLPALDVGGTHVSAALVSAATWSVVPESIRRQPLRSDGTAQEILAAIVECANSVHSTTGQRWGAAVPGPFDYERGIGLFEGVAKFESLFGVDVRRALLDGLQPPASDVVFLNDADAFLLGEWVAGAAVGHHRAVAITLGTGVGSAFLSDGVVISEHPSVPREGRVDLLPIAGRPLEETVSRRAILARYAQLVGSSAAGGRDVLEIAGRARHGEVAARQVLDDAMTALGVTLAPWLARFGATVLVVGGSMAASWDLLAGALRRSITDTEPASAARLTVVRARQPTYAALIGAAWHAARRSGQSGA